MKKAPVLAAALFCFAIPLLTGCATAAPKKAAETISTVYAVPNSSGITLGQTNSYGPKNLLGFSGGAPDIPSRTGALVENIRPVPSGGPSHSAVLGGVQAVSIENPAAYNRRSINFADTIRQWRLLIEDGSMPESETEKILFEDQLTEIPWQDAGRGELAKLRRHAFPWGKAVVFLTTCYAQGPTEEPVNNEMLTLVVQGITSDGRYAVNGHFAMRHPKLPSSPNDKNRSGKVIFDLDNEGKKAAQWLDEQPDNSFEPTFLQYETFLDSLRIEPPSKR